MDHLYFRYIMKDKGHDPRSLAKLLGVCKDQMNRKIKNGIFNLDEIRKILALFGMSFEDVFKDWCWCIDWESLDQKNHKFKGDMNKWKS